MWENVSTLLFVFNSMFVILKKCVFFKIIVLILLLYVLAQDFNKRMNVFEKGFIRVLTQKLNLLIK